VEDLNIIQNLELSGVPFLVYRVIRFFQKINDILGGIKNV